MALIICERKRENYGEYDWNAAAQKMEFTFPGKYFQITAEMEIIESER